MNFMDSNSSQEPEDDGPVASDLKSEASLQTKKRRAGEPLWIVALVFIYLFGLGSGYGLWGQQAIEHQAVHAADSEMKALAKQVNPEEGYILPISFGDIGPQMVAAGVFDREQFIQVYEQAGQPLTEVQLSILDGTYQGSLVMNRENAYFLLNFLWAIGLSNKNPIMETGLIQRNGQAQAERFASTGGWSLATKPVGEIFSSLELIELTPEQQISAQQAAEAVYRPCCDNPTHFPDCNHGMAMLGLLELMASQDASLDEMFDAAKYVNAFWYPQQTLEQAVFFQKSEGTAYQDIDAKTIVGRQFSSGTGFSALHQFLSQQGWLPDAPKTGGSCGV